MKKFKTKEFWGEIADRAIKTFAESMLSVITVSGIAVGFADINWGSALSISGVAVIVSVLTNIATLKD